MSRFDVVSILSGTGSEIHSKGNKNVCVIIIVYY